MGRIDRIECFGDLGQYSDFEDSTIGGNLTITGLRTCWLGAGRNHVRENVVDANNKMADPDANEALANVIHGSIACFGNSPAVQYGDSGSSPNQVRRHACVEPKHPEHHATKSLIRGRPVTAQPPGVENRTAPVGR